MAVRIDSRHCTGTYAKEYMEKNYRKGASDTARPRYHFCPVSGWMNDPNGGFYANGAYHLFYLQDPFQADGFSEAVLPDGTVIEGQEKPNRFWGHTMTRDFEEWHYLPPALVPDRKNGEIKPISGSVIRRKDGSYLMVFTSVRQGEERFYIKGALSDDNLNRWSRLTSEVVKPPVNLALEGDWRDPYMFIYHDRYYMVIGAAAKEDALLLLYEAEDDELQQWQYRGIMISRPRHEVTFFECPKVLVLGDRLTLIFSPFKQMEYYTGNLAEDGIFHVEYSGKVDYGLLAYAAEDIQNESGDTYLFSWAPGWFNLKGLLFEGGNGCVTTPRRVWLREDGHLMQEPCVSLKQYREWEISCQAGEDVLAREVPLQFEMIAYMNTEKEWNLSFYDTDTKECVQEVSYRDYKLVIDGEEIFLSRDELAIRCFCDGFLWEYFISDGEAVITSGIAVIPQAVDIVINRNAEHKCCRKVQLWKIKDAKISEYGRI